MASDLEQATRVHEHDGRYVARLSDRWEIWGPNGGYLASIALRAAGLQAHIQQPRSLYCHFLSSPAFDAVQLDVRVLKRGRRAESFAVEMGQDGKPILHALIKTAADGLGHSYQRLSAPDAPAPAELASYDRAGLNSGRPVFSFWDNVERRVVQAGTSDGSSEPVIREWVRFRPTACFEDPFVDAARSLILLDTFGFPAAYQRFGSEPYVAPSLDTSIWLHRFNPRCEWLLVDHECTVAEHGLLGVNGRVWDTDGRLLATGSAHLCCLPSATESKPTS
jgi:acyl-CoA thioesterase II